MLQRNAVGPAHPPGQLLSSLASGRWIGAQVGRYQAYLVRCSQAFSNCRCRFVRPKSWKRNHISATGVVGATGPRAGPLRVARGRPSDPVEHVADRVARIGESDVGRRPTSTA